MRNAHNIGNRHTSSVFECLAIPPFSTTLPVSRYTRLYFTHHSYTSRIPLRTASPPPFFSTRHSNLALVGDVLAFLHDCGLVHNDVKPGKSLHDRRYGTLVLDLDVLEGKYTGGGERVQLFASPKTCYEAQGYNRSDGESRESLGGVSVVWIVFRLSQPSGKMPLYFPIIGENILSKSPKLHQVWFRSCE